MGVGGEGLLGKDRQTSGAPIPTAIRHTSAISDQPSVPGMATRSAARRLSMSFPAVLPPHLSVCGDTDGASRYSATAQQRVMNIHPGFADITPRAAKVT